MSALPWLKLWTETLHDRKITKAPPVTRWAWIACLMLAAQGGNGGRLDLTPGKPSGDKRRRVEGSARLLFRNGDVAPRR